MARLKTMPPRVASAKPRLGYAEGDIKAQDRSRNDLAPWRKWYSTARWRKLKAAIHLRDLYTCQMCGRVSDHGIVADHKQPHRGDAALFWDERNVETLCVSCHSGAKQAQERAEQGF